MACSRPVVVFAALAALLVCSCVPSAQALPTLITTGVQLQSSPPPPPAIKGALTATDRSGIKGMTYYFSSPPPPPPPVSCRSPPPPPHPPCYQSPPPSPPPPCYQSPPPPSPPSPSPPPPPPPPCYQSPPPPPPPPCYQSPPPPPPPCYQSPPPPPPPPCYQSPPPPPPPCYQSPPPPPPPCYQSPQPPPPCNSPPSTYYNSPDFPYTTRCSCDSSGVYKIKRTNTYYASHDSTRYCFRVQAKRPDYSSHKQCRNFDLWSINFRVHHDCQGQVSDLTFNGQGLAPVWVANLPPNKAMLQISRGGGGDKVLDGQDAIAEHGAEVCFTLPNYCPLDKFCKGDHCKTAFYPSPYTGLKCCPSWQFGSH